MRVVERSVDSLVLKATQQRCNRKVYVIDVISDGVVESSDEWIELSQTIEEYLDYLVRYNSNPNNSTTNT